MVSNPADLRRRVESELDRLGPAFEALCLDLHRQPELGCREVNTVTRLAGELEEEDFQVATGIAGLATAFRAERGQDGPSIAFLAEYDAIPGLGHACGHNLLCAASYGAAVALARTVEGRAGRVLLIGAPAEETIGGKVVLAARGAYEGLDAALLAHPAREDRALVRSLASWSVDVVFEGRPAHAVAAPEEGINALDAAVQLFIARDALLKALDHEVRIPGVLLEGGVRPNLVPERARARFSLRAATSEYLVETVIARFRDVVEGVARATGTRATIEPIDNLYDELVGNPVLAELYSGHALRAGMKPAAGPGRPFGSLDIGTLSHRIPVLHPLFRISTDVITTHTRAFAAAASTAEAVRAARRAALALAWTGLDLLTDPALLARAWSTFEAASQTAPVRPDVPLVADQPES
jgi:amidohydrolase